MIDLNQNECLNILIDNYIGHLGYLANGIPYVIPISYFYDQESKTIISYAAEGHKISAMRENKNVALNVQEITSITNWKSVLAHGTFEELNQIDAKQLLHKFSDGIKSVILKKEHKSTEFISEFSNKLYSRGNPIVFRIHINEITGKRKEA